MRVLFRVDASFLIGSGHVMRCITLARELREEGATCIFFCRSHPHNLIDLIANAGFEVRALPLIATALSGASQRGLYEGWLGSTEEEDFLACSAAAAGECFDWAVMDHYGLAASWQAKARAFAKKILTLDDLANRALDTDILVNQNISANGWAEYHRLVSPKAVRLTGPRFCLLREEFAARRKLGSLRRSVPPYRVLVFYGGTDQQNATEAALEALRPLGDVVENILVVLGAANLNAARIYRLAEEQANVQVLTGVTNMAELMASSDICLGAGGTTTWERAALGLPSIVSVLAENQADISIQAEARGILRLAGSGCTVTPGELRAAFLELVNAPGGLKGMAEAASALVDGGGTARVAACWKEFRRERVSISGNQLSAELVFHPALEEHAMILLLWRNDDQSRAGSLSQHLISLEEHRNWFTSALLDQDREIYLLKLGEAWCGTVRFSRAVAAEWELSWMIAPEFRSRGLAKVAVSLARQRKLGQKLMARIRSENSASKKAAAAAGFAWDSTKDGVEIWLTKSGNM